MSWIYYWISWLLLRKPLRWIYKALGGKELTRDDLSKFETTRYPWYYHVFYYTFVVAFILSFIVVSFGLSFFLLSPKIFELQKNIYGNGSMYFTSDIGFITGLATVFGNMFLFGGLIVYPLWRLFSENFQNFYYKQQASNRWYGKVAFKTMLVTAAVLYLLAAPFILLGFRDYKAVFDDRIVANDFFSLENKNYSFSEVSSVDATSEVSEDANIINSLVFQLTDGRKAYFNPVADMQQPGNEIRELYSKLRNENVDLRISMPAGPTLSLVDRKCAKEQEIFYALFELNEPITGSSFCF